MNKNTSSGSILIEVLIALFIFTSTSTYLLASTIDSALLWQMILKTQSEHDNALNSARLALNNDRVDQNWNDVAVFGMPTVREPPPK